jgi:hypothetical protein
VVPELDEGGFVRRVLLQPPLEFLEFPALDGSALAC